MSTHSVKQNIRKTLIILVSFIVALLTCWYFLSPIFQRNIPSVKNATIINSSSNIKDFTLTATNGYEFNEKSLKGHWTLMFFGYTGCPDVCPETLKLTSDVWNNFSQKPARFVFSSIDSHQDSIPKLKNFLKRFNSDFIGVTGDPEQSRKLREQLGIYVEATTTEGVTLLNHTSSLMLINPKGQLHAVLSPPFDTKELKHDLLILTGNK